MLDIFNPSTTIGALVIGIIAGLFSGVILGFFQGRSYERKIIYNGKINQKGNKNTAIQNSKYTKE